MEQVFRLGTGQQRADTEAPGRLTENRHLPAITGKGTNVFLHPLQRGQLVAHAQVGVCIQLRCHSGKIRKPHGAQPVGGIHHHHILATRQFGTVIENLGYRARQVAATVEPHHHRERPFAVRHPDIQVQAILTGFLNPHHRVFHLQRGHRVMIYRLLCSAVRQRLRRLEAQLAQRRPRKRHTAVFGYAFVAKPLIAPLSSYCCHPLHSCFARLKLTCINHNERHRAHFIRATDS